MSVCVWGGGGGGIVVVVVVVVVVPAVCAGPGAPAAGLSPAAVFAGLQNLFANGGEQLQQLHQQAQQQVAAEDQRQLQWQGGQQDVAAAQWAPVPGHLAVIPQRLAAADRATARRNAGAGVWNWLASDRSEPVRAHALHVARHPFQFLHLLLACTQIDCAGVEEGHVILRSRKEQCVAIAHSLFMNCCLHVTTIPTTATATVATTVATITTTSPTTTIYDNKNHNTAITTRGRDG